MYVWEVKREGREPSPRVSDSDNIEVLLTKMKKEGLGLEEIERVELLGMSFTSDLDLKPGEGITVEASEEAA